MVNSCFSSPEFTKAFTKQSATAWSAFPACSARTCAILLPAMSQVSTGHSHCKVALGSQYYWSISISIHSLLPMSSSSGLPCDVLYRRSADPGLKLRRPNAGFGARMRHLEEFFALCPSAQPSPGQLGQLQFGE
jgi:hypothetical protein